MALPNEIHPFAIAGGGNQYQVANSLRFRASNSAYLSKAAFGTATNNLKWTFSCWMKRGILSTTQGIFDAYLDGSNFSSLMWDNSNTLLFYNIIGGADSSVSTTPLYRDVSAWYHIMLVYDTANATAADRAILYVNGSKPTQTNPAGAFGSSESTYLNSNYAMTIGKRTDGSVYFDGYMAEVYFVDGQALSPSDFGQTDSITSQWQPKKYIGTYGIKGFYLPFNDATSTTTLGYDRQLSMTDSSKNNWTLNNISVTSGVTYDWMIDSPTNYNDGSTYYNRGNYCTGNPVNGDGVTWTNGNLNFSIPNGSGNGQGTIGVSSGKWYYEGIPSVSLPNGFGIQQIGLTTRFTSGVQYQGDGTKNVNGVSSAYGASFTNGDVIGVAFDMDAQTVTFYKNNVSQGSISTSGIGMTTATFASCGGGGITNTGSVNFGQRPFTYTPPTGYKALNTYNLANPSLPLV